MKKLKLFAFSLITFLCFGVISVNAQTVIVEDLEGYKSALSNDNATEIKLENSVDIGYLDGANYKDVIHVDKNIVLDLNGNTITTGDYGTITVYYYGDYTFTIKNGNINAVCGFGVCPTAPIVILNTSGCTNCNTNLVLEDITFSTNTLFKYLININTPPSGSKYNVEMDNITSAAGLQATELFAHNFAHNPASPILNLNIKSMSETNVQYINANDNSEYKVKDILDSSTTELLINGTVITDPETIISKRSVSNGFEIRPKNVIDVVFDDAQHGYSSVSAKSITIKNNNSDSITVKSVTVSNTNKFTVSGNTQPTIVAGSIDNSSFTIKPVAGLSVGKHTETITVTDTEDKTYTGNVTFTVGKVDVNPSVSIDGWFYEERANTPSVTGNLGNATITYEYKLQDSSDNTYSATVPTNVGKYTVRATIASSTNYNGGVATANFSIEYKVTDGDGQKHTIGTNKNAVFRIDADKDLFLKAYLNDEELNSEFYTITEGSTIITLKQEFLNNLLPGTYNLRAAFSNGGEANTTFVIAQRIENSPKTSDSIMISIIFGSISLIGLLVSALYLKNKNA